MASREGDLTAGTTSVLDEAARYSPCGVKSALLVAVGVEKL